MKSKQSLASFPLTGVPNTASALLWSPPWQFQVPFLGRGKLKWLLLIESLKNPTHYIYLCLTLGSQLVSCLDCRPGPRLLSCVTAFKPVFLTHGGLHEQISRWVMNRLHWVNRSCWSFLFLWGMEVLCALTICASEHLCRNGHKVDLLATSTPMSRLWLLWLPFLQSWEKNSLGHNLVVTPHLMV